VKPPVERQPSSRNCFVCGRDNPLGLRTRWDSDREKGEVRCTVTVPAPYNGYPGVVHGGIVTSLLDEAMGRSQLIEGGFDDLLVTARLEIAFRRTAPTGVPLTVVARTVRRSGSRAQCVAELRLPGGEIAATAEGLMTRPPPDVAQAWEAERAGWRVDRE
jgi:acyl-coenzyme A thioesterase PaaI-like protein